MTDEQCQYLARQIDVQCALRSEGLRREDAEDLKMYVWEQCLRRAGKWNPGKAKWSTFCQLIVSNAVKDGRKWLWRQWQRGRASDEENKELNQ